MFRYSFKLCIIFLCLAFLSFTLEKDSLKNIANDFMESDNKNRDLPALVNRCDIIIKNSKVLRTIEKPESAEYKRLTKQLDNAEAVKNFIIAMSPESEESLSIKDYAVFSEYVDIDYTTVQEFGCGNMIKVHLGDYKVICFQNPTNENTLINYRWKNPMKAGSGKLALPGKSILSVMDTETMKYLEHTKFTDLRCE